MSSERVQEKLLSEINASSSKSTEHEDLSADIVDKLFKEFLNERIKSTSVDSSNSLEQINALLDSQITHGTHGDDAENKVTNDRRGDKLQKSSKSYKKSKHKSKKKSYSPSREKRDRNSRKKSQSPERDSQQKQMKSISSVVSVEEKHIDEGKEVCGSNALGIDSVFGAMPVQSDTKKALNISLKISNASADFISSGEVVKHRKRKKNLEDGEVSSPSQTSSDDSHDDYSDISDDGSQHTVNGDHKTKKHKTKTKRKKKSKHKGRESSKKSRRSRSNSKSKSRSRDKKRSRSRSRERHESRRSRSRSKDKHHRESRSRSKDKHHSRRSRSRSREDKYQDRPFRLFPPKRKLHSRSRSPKNKDLRFKIDKAKLREKAIARTMTMIKTGQAPGTFNSAEMSKIVSGGQSVNELTDYCKRISTKGAKEEGQGDMSLSSDTESEGSGRERGSEFDRMAYRVKMEPANIVMNIRNSKQLPTLSAQQKAAAVGTLRLQFPVSSGSQHRAKEWVPVQPTTATPTPTTNSKTLATTTAATKTTSATAAAATVNHPSTAPIPDDKVFPDVAETLFDIGSIVSQRLHAVRQLQKNPNDVQAISQMSHVQLQASQWAQSKNLPGQFMGSTGANIMSQQEIMGPKRFQAWAKKDQLSNAAPLRGGIGMFLLQKMGWKSGEGLGKNNEGALAPLALEFKIDRKGLTSQDEMTKGGKKWAPTAPRVGAQAPRVMDMSGKHPVSALMEICNRRRWGQPQFTVVQESGPPHKRNFIFKVRVNNIEYQPAVAGGNKKVAKSAAATVCLQELGMLPR